MVWSIPLLLFLLSLLGNVVLKNGRKRWPMWCGGRWVLETETGKIKAKVGAQLINCNAHYRISIATINSILYTSLCQLSSVIFPLFGPLPSGPLMGLLLPFSSPPIHTQLPLFICTLSLPMVSASLTPLYTYQLLL